MTLSIVIRCILTGFLVAVPAPFIVGWLQSLVGLNPGIIIYLAAAVSAILGGLILGATTATAPESSAAAPKAKAPGTEGGGGQADGRETGVVKWFNVSKGFGFITRSSGEDVFVHYRSIRSGGRRTLSDGQKVEFVVATGDKGLQAEDVSVVS